MAARTAKVAMCMETIMKPYRFENADVMMLLSFLGQFKNACDFYEVSESVAIWLLPFFTTKSPDFYLFIRLTFRKVAEFPIVDCRGE